MKYQRKFALAMAFIATLATILTPGIASATAAARPVHARTGGGPSTGAYDPQLIDNQDSALLAEMGRQERLAPAAQVLLEAATKLPPQSGFAGVGYEGDGVTLYYKGTVSPLMTAAIATARRTAAVTTRSAAYSRFELEQAQHAVDDAVAARHGEVQAVGVAGDGSGIMVEKMPTATAAAMRSALATRKGITSTRAETLLAGLKLTVPVKVTTAAGPVKLMSSREDDFSPWNGGDEYQTWRGLDERSGWCTTGFGVMKDGQSYVLTAAHCMTSPDVAYNGHFSGCCFEEIGPVYQEDSDKDILLINARGSVLIFDGGVNSSYQKTVHSWGYRVNRELLCTSGSRSGVICGDKTNPYEWDMNFCDSDGDCFKMHDLARADNVNGQCVGSGGDSGGPVFSLDGDGVRAKGTITGTNHSNCKILYFQDMDEIVGSMRAIPFTA